MNRLRKNNGMYRYLEAQGLLDKGIDEIKAGKAQYRKEYLTNHKRNYRKRTTSHTITCTPIEERALSLAAYEYGMTIAEYVRMSALAYAAKKYLVPQSDALVKLRQELVFLRSQVARVGTEKRGLFGRDRSEQIEQLLETIASTVKTAFQEPKELEAVIRTTIVTEPEFLKVLETILASHDYKVDRKQE
jgi:enamine deaminase RidA (YjgF/YER057c/UK114 family)